MSWKWEELTSPEFAKAIKATKGVCIVPLGVIERHSTHLPLGTDLIAVRAVAEGAAEREPAIIFPSYFFTQVHETKNYPGAIAINRQLQLDLLENVCEEIARNGMKKIILLNGHGGNEFMLPYFVMDMLERPRNFTLYLVRLSHYLPAGSEAPEWKEMMQSKFDLHAGEIETSAILSIRPDLVKMEEVAPGVQPKKLLDHLPNVMTSVWWYADYPEQYAGDATHATAEKGEFLMDRYVSRVAEIIRTVKGDTKTAELESEYLSASGLCEGDK
jgi:creatinine amidohydrolase